MKIATWNVNSIRKRLDRVIPWLDQHRPDVLCVQETKVEDDAFPRAEIEAAGYHVLCHGQKSYNGVALLTREPARDPVWGFGDDVQDPQARFLVASVGQVRVGTVYVPNGQEVGSEKFRYKLEWLDRWRKWLDKHGDKNAEVAFCGDLNVAPDDRDVYDPVGWKDQVLCHPDERAALTRVCEWGLTDTFRQLGFPKNRGVRIDMILCTPALSSRLVHAAIDREARKGKDPSDHAPVLAEFK